MIKRYGGAKVVLEAVIHINKAIKQQAKEDAVRSVATHVKSHQHNCPNVSFTRATPLDTPN